MIREENQREGAGEPYDILAAGNSGEVSCQFLKRLEGELHASVVLRGILFGLKLLQGGHRCSEEAEPVSFATCCIKAGPCASAALSPCDFKSGRGDRASAKLGMAESGSQQEGGIVW